LALFFVTLATFLLLRTPDSIGTAVVVAVLLTLAVYLRHMLIAVSLLFLVAFALRFLLLPNRKALKLAAWMPLLIVAMLLAPWVVRNYVVLGAFIPLTTSSGSNLYGGNNPEADGGYVSSEPYVLPNLTEVESDRIFTERAFSWISSNPVAFAKLLPLKAARLFWGLSLGTSSSIEVPEPVFLAILLFTLTSYSLVLFGAWRLVLARHYWELYSCAPFHSRWC
jgi:hypothetical protein